MEVTLKVKGLGLLHHGVYRQLYGLTRLVLGITHRTHKATIRVVVVEIHVLHNVEEQIDMYQRKKYYINAMH